MNNPASFGESFQIIFLDQTLKINEAILNEMSSCDRIYILGAGTSMNAGFIGKTIFFQISKHSCRGSYSPQNLHMICR